MDRSFSQEIEEILRAKFPDVIVSYWGHDPDDLEFAPDSEDGWSGTYEAFMADCDIEKWLNSDFHWFSEECMKRKMPFLPSVLFHSIEATQKYYPKIYNEYLRRRECQNS